MAPHRAFSFPLSYTEETARLPPFVVSKKDLSKLRSCEAFRIIRELLVDQDDQACEKSISTLQVLSADGIVASATSTATIAAKIRTPGCFSETSPMPSSSPSSKSTAMPYK